ncbi:MAG: hypothetical protein KA998_03840, partial [Rickettsiaceae bacterium]|nr:hypothetical protein [Rickettsiaceae bacterium]
MPEDFFAIQQSLREKLAVLQEENELINRTQESKKPLKEKDIDSVNRLIPPFSSEEIMLMLQAKSDKRRAKGRPSYCPFLIDDANKNKFINFLAGISKDKPFHYDIILTNGNHCTPLQIHSDGIDIRMFSLDAAGDNRNQQAIEEIEDALGIISYNNSEVGTQKDSISCSIYS